MTNKQKAAISRHGEQLEAIFHTGLDPVVLFKKLRRIEGAATKITTDYCNGTINADQVDTQLLRIKIRLIYVLAPGKAWIDLKNKGVFINGDPRGYALKIYGEYMRAHGLKLYTDMGGLGVLAPEFGKDGK